MAASRRKFLQVLGGGGLVLAAGTGWWAYTREPKKAYLPWQQAGSLYADPIRNALSYAILAPNPHNRQPWLVDLKSDTEAVLYCQLDRRLPDTDPLNRQITVGLGCFLELLRIAAAQNKHRTEITPFPDGSDAQALDHRPIAHIRLVSDPSVAQDPLFDAILKRHTDRSAFDISRPVEKQTLDAIVQAAGKKPGISTVTDTETIRVLRKLSWDAYLTEVETPSAMGESIELMRIGKQAILTSPDGISISGAVPEAMARLGVLTPETLTTPGTIAWQQSLDYMKPAIDTAMGYVVVATQGNERPDQLAAGQSYVQLHLAAAQKSVSMHPLSQALQEYSEMNVHYQEIHELLAKPGETLQMFARIGYGAGAHPAPRWSLETRIQDT